MKRGDYVDNNKTYSTCVSYRTKLKICVFYFLNLLFLLAMIAVFLFYYKEFYLQLKKVKVLEESVREIMCELDEIKSMKNVIEGSKNNFKISCTGHSEQYSKQLFKRGFEKFCFDLHKEILATKKSIEQFLKADKCKANNVDNTGIQIGVVVNYALESLGAKIVYIKDTPIFPYQHLFRFFFDWFRFSNPPRELLRHTLEPGSCYGFRGHHSIVVIKLAKFVEIEQISIDHILDTMSPTGDISSAPKNFIVYGLIGFENSIGNNEVLLGNFTYDIFSRQHLQFFNVERYNFSNSFRFIKFEFFSNYGNKNFTCVYRVGVHGKFSD